jgi:hypothetical protein
MCQFKRIYLHLLISMELSDFGQSAVVKWCMKSKEHMMIKFLVSGSLLMKSTSFQLESKSQSKLIDYY